MLNAAMTYEEFVAAYKAAFAKMLTYKLTEVGCGLYADQMAELADTYPEFLAKFEEAE